LVLMSRLLAIVQDLKCQLQQSKIQENALKETSKCIYCRNNSSVHTHSVYCSFINGLPVPCVEFHPRL
jgi:GTP cyclohydrolase FolE2